MKIVYAALAVLFLSASALAASAPSAPATLAAKNGAVTFDHAKHAKLDCAKCHAARGGKLSPLGKEKGHATCLECHKAEAKGPTKCAECHKK